MRSISLRHLARQFRLLPVILFAGIFSPLFAEQAELADEPLIKKDTSRPVYTTTAEMNLEARATAQILERFHIRHRPLRELNSDAIIRSYAENLDALRLFFLESEIKNYQERFGPLLDIYIQRGNLNHAFVIYRDFLSRVEERTTWINQRLDQPFNFHTDDIFDADRRKSLWPQTKEEADQLWTHRLKLDIMLELLGEEPKTAVDKPTQAAPKKLPPEKISPEKLAEAITRVRKRYNKIKTYLTFEPYEIEEIYLNSLTTQYDPHTTFFSKPSWIEFSIAMNNALSGVGAMLQDEDGYCTIREILPGGPIEASRRIKVGDRIIAIGQGKDGDLIDIVGMRLNKVVNQLRGQPDTHVRLRIEPAIDRTARYTITLQRTEIKLTTKLAHASLVELPMGEQTIPIGIITIPAFYGKSKEEAFSTSEDVKELIGKLKKHHVQALVLDIRRNGGGVLDEAVKLTGLFIPTGPVLQVRGADGKTLQLDDKDRDVAWDGPLVVLVSKLSASASEIFAGALQNHQRAIIVGDERTHGKGSVQSVISFDNINPQLGSAAKLTIQKWYLPSGNSIQLQGVPSDILVPSIYSVLPVAESDLQNPLPWDAISSVLDLSENNVWRNNHPQAVVAPEIVEKLREESVRRQAELPEFLTLGRTIAWTKSREQNRTFPLNYDRLRDERIEDQSFRESIREAHQNLAAHNFKSEPFKLDAALVQEKEAEALKTAESAADQKTSEEKEEEEDWPDFDAQQREAVRIAGDWVARLRATTSPR